MIGTAAAIIGSAVIGAGASALSSHNAASAAEKSGQLQYQAAQDQIASNERLAGQIRADNEPFRQIGLGAAGALAGGLGLPVSMTGGAPQPSYNYGSAPAGGMTGMGGADDFGGGRPGTLSAGGSTPTQTNAQAATPDWDAYWKANPDLAASQWLNSQQVGDLTGDGKVDYQDLAADHYRDFGKDEGRALPTATQSPATQPTGSQAPPGYTDPTSGGGGYVIPQRPAPYVAPTRPTALPTPERPTTPAMPERPMTAPLDVSLGSYQQSPDYQFRFNEAQRAVGNAAASMGGVMSGARIKAAEQRAKDLAAGDYGDWRNFTAGQWNTGNARSDANYSFDVGQYNTTNNRADANFQFDTGQRNINQNRQDLNFNTDEAFGYGLNRDAQGDFENDRGYTAQRYDTRNNMLLSMAGFGTQANSANQSAATTFQGANNNLTMTGAQARGNAAVNASNAWSNGINNLMTTGAYLGGQYLSGRSAASTPYLTAANVPAGTVLPPY